MSEAENPLDPPTPGPSKREVSGDPTKSGPVTPEDKIEGSMHTEEPLGWDQAPQAIDDPEQKRHPRPDGVGGLKSSDSKKNS